MYVQSFKLNGAYTPQVVVNGSRQLVGSNATAMNAAIEEAKSSGSISFEATRNGAMIDATIRTDVPSSSDLFLVVFENGLTTSIAGGENSGRKATDDAIVRKLWRVKPGKVSVPISASWKNIGVAVFLQDRATRTITAAAVRYV